MNSIPGSRSDMIATLVVGLARRSRKGSRLSVRKNIAGTAEEIIDQNRSRFRELWRPAVETAHIGQDQRAGGPAHLDRLRQVGPQIVLEKTGRRTFAVAEDLLLQSPKHSPVA